MHARRRLLVVVAVLVVRVVLAVLVACERVGDALLADGGDPAPLGCGSEHSCQKRDDSEPPTSVSGDLRFLRQLFCRSASNPCLPINRP